jgi:hypothetical protein
MADDVSRRVQELPNLDTSALRALWQNVFPTPPHPKLRRELMIPILAYRIQEQAYGGLGPEALSKLKRLAKDLERNRSTVAGVSRIKPGTRIIREWAGDTHEVTVVRNGYSYRGKQYKSLSAIARKITGTRWSGPVFFGLKSRPSGKVEG